MRAAMEPTAGRSRLNPNLNPNLNLSLILNPIRVPEAEGMTAAKTTREEIDYVTNITAVKDGNWDYVEREMTTIADICRSAGVLSKVIFENCYLEKSEIEHLAKISLRAKPDFIKTSTGFGTGGATVELLIPWWQVLDSLVIGRKV